MVLRIFICIQIHNQLNHQFIVSLINQSIYQFFFFNATPFLNQSIAQCVCFPNHLLMKTRSIRLTQGSAQRHIYIAQTSGSRCHITSVVNSISTSCDNNCTFNAPMQFCWASISSKIEQFSGPPTYGYIVYDRRCLSANTGAVFVKGKQ